VGDQRIVSAFSEELASVICAFLQVETHAVPVPGDWIPGWTIRCAIAGAEPGQLVVTISDADALRLTSVVLGSTAAEPAEITDTLTEVASQACGSLSQRPEVAGAKVNVKDVVHGHHPEAGAASAFDFPVGTDFTLRVACGHQVAERPAAPPPAPKAAAVPPSVSQYNPVNLDVLMDIDLPLTVRFGQTEMPIQALSRLGPGSIIDLGRSPDEPVDVMVNGKVIARGEVVVVAGNYGVRVTEVVSTNDRVRSMGA
jgi:flagellar motor switch protein FliN